MQALIPFPNISPEIFSISLFGVEFALRWYALAYIAGLLIGWWIAVRAIKRATLWANDTSPMTPKQVEDLLTWVILGVILGGRLGIVLFYEPSYYFANPGEILKIWNGGMAFHGGLLGVVIATFLYCRSLKLDMLKTADMMALATPPGLFLGRIANFINGELWGRPTDVPWAVIFPSYGPNDPVRVCGEILTDMCARHPSQLYEAALEGFILGAVLLYLAFRAGKLKTPGFVCGVFFAGYAIGRFIVEFFRQPDVSFQSETNPLGLALHMNGYGLTQGQLLSLPMLALGLFLIWQAKRRKS